MDNPEPPATPSLAQPSRSSERPGVTGKQTLVLAALVLFLASFFSASYFSRPVGEVFHLRFVNSLIGTINHILTPGGMFCIVGLIALFYYLRVPRDRGTVEDGYELLDHAQSLQRKGNIEAAIKAYEYIAAKYAHIEPGRDAQISIKQLREAGTGLEAIKPAKSDTAC